MVVPLRFLCVSVTLLHQTFHGRCDRGRPEWPPSPLRIFQALIAAAAARFDERIRLVSAATAFQWLERLPAPVIIAPVALAASTGYRLSVPNNSLDVVARAWSRGNLIGTGDANPATHRSMKSIRTTRLVRGDAVHFVWPLPSGPVEEYEGHVCVLSTAARSLTALGWGIDVAIGDARVIDEVTAAELADDDAQRWVPVLTTSANAEPLRLPVAGTFDALADRHASFLTRIDRDTFRPVPPLRAYQVRPYSREHLANPRSFAAFALRCVDAPEKFRAFRQQLAVKVAAMLRHVACEASKEHWPFPEDSEVYVAGHTAPKRGATPPRFSYLMLPSIGGRNADGMIRRVVIAEPFDGDGAHAAWALERLMGCSLVDEDTAKPIATLDRIDAADGVLAMYTSTSIEWTTVTPIVLPGYDDRKIEKAAVLLSRACDQAGIPPGSVDAFEFTEAISRSDPGLFVPKYLRGLPLRNGVIRFKHEFRGPIAIGAGRHCGIGVLAVCGPRA